MNPLDDWVLTPVEWEAIDKVLAHPDGPGHLPKNYQFRKVPEATSEEGAFLILGYRFSQCDTEVLARVWECLLS